MLKAVYKFEKDKLFHSSKILVPILFLVTYTGCSYTVGPLEILSSFGAAASIVFALMVSIGVIYGNMNYNMIDQAIFVKLPKKEYFYFGKIIIMAEVSMVFALFSVFLPVAIHVFNGGGLFKRSVEFADIFSGILLFWLIGMSGGLLGIIANQKIIKERKYVILLCTFLSIVTIVKVPINKEFIIAKFFTWILPPVYDLSFFYSKDAYFQFSSTWIYFMWISIYIIIEIILYVKVMLKIGFE